MKKFLSILLALVMVLSLVACGTQTTEQEAPAQDGGETVQTLNIRLCHNGTTNDGDLYNFFAVKFKELVEEYSEGNITVEIFPNAQYGSEREQIEAVQFGTCDMSVTTNAQISNFCQATAAVDLPFMFANNDAAGEALDGPAGQAIFAELKNAGFTGIKYGAVGFRHLVTKDRPIYCSDDLKGLKMRSLESALYLDTYTAIGANAVPMAWAEVPAGLQQGTIDGLCIPINQINAGSFYDLAGYTSLTSHFYNALLLMANNNFFDGLSAEQQQIIRKAGEEAGDLERAELANLETEWLANLEAHGMTIVTEDEIDFDSFTSKVQPIYDQYSELIGGTIVEDLQAAAKAAAK